MKRLFTLAAVLSCLGACTCRGGLVNAIQAVVHDSVITREQVDRLTEQTADVLRRDARSEADYERRMNTARQENLEKLMDRELILKEFKTAGYNLPESVTDEIVQERIRSRYGDRRTLTKTLQSQGLTYEKFRQQVREQFIIEALRQKNISSEIIISPQKVENFYAANKEQFKLEEQVKLRAIILTRPPNGSIDEVRPLANEILSKIKEGAAFAEMATIYSQGSEKKDGGLRPLQEVSQLRKELAEPVSKLKPGEVSGLVETPEAIWILKLEERVASHFKPINDVRDQIEKELLAQERARVEKQWIEKIRRKTFVRYY